MRTYIFRLLALLMLFAPRGAEASSESRYSPLIRQVKGWPSERIVARGDSLLRRGEEDNALVMYMLVCARTGDRMTEEELADCALANLKAGDVYYARGSYVNALENYQAALKLSEASRGKRHLAQTYNNIGKVYCMFKDYGKGYEYYQKGYRICPATDRRLAFSLLSNLFGACLDRGDLDGARRYRRLMRAAPHADDAQTRFLLDFSTALLASREGRYDEANRTLLRLTRLAESDGLPTMFLCSAYNALYDNYQATGDVAQAARYVRLCMDTARQHQMLHYYPETLRELGKIYKQEGDAETAQRYETQYITLVDSIYNAQRFNVVKNQQFMYEVDKANKEISRLQQEEESHRQRASLYLLLLVVSVAAAAVVSALLAYVLRQKRRLEASWRKLYDNYREQTAPAPSRPAQRRPSAQGAIKEELRGELLAAIRRVMDETDAWCQPDFTIAQMARLIGSNDRYVSMVVNDHYGKSFTELLNDYRVRRACDRLTGGAAYDHLTIAAIGQSVGYKSQTTFINQFRKITGLTPSVYKKFAAEDQRRAGEE